MEADKVRIHYVTYPSSKPWCSDFTAQNLSRFSENTVMPTTYDRIKGIENAVIHIHNVQILGRWLSPISLMKKLHAKGNKVMVGLRGAKGEDRFDQLIRDADGVAVGVDKALYDYASRLNDNVFVLPPGEDPDKFKPIPDVYKEYVLSWVGRDNKKFKNAGLLRQLGYSYRKATYNRYIPHDRLPLFYNKSHILVNFSDHEGFWRPGIEAAMCGLPIISTDVGVVRDILDPDYIVPLPAREHLDLYREKIQQLLDDPVKAAGVGVTNRIRTLKYSWRNVAPLHDKAWGELL